MSEKTAGTPSQDGPAQPGKPSDHLTEEDQPKPRKSLPMVSVPDDNQVMADEMAELFDEDRVSHQHGSSEPEAD